MTVYKLTLEVTVKVEEFEEDKPTRTPSTGPMSVACPYCLAGVGVLCIGPRGGKLKGWHKARSRAARKDK